MANFDAVGVYLSHVDQFYGKDYADCVGRFQEGFLADKVCSDLDAAFERAVKTTEVLVEQIKKRNA